MINKTPTKDLIPKVGVFFLSFVNDFGSGIFTLSLGWFFKTFCHIQFSTPFDIYPTPNKLLLPSCWGFFALKTKRFILYLNTETSLK